METYLDRMNATVTIDELIAVVKPIAEDERIDVQLRCDVIRESMGVAFRQEGAQLSDIMRIDSELGKIAGELYKRISQ